MQVFEDGVTSCMGIAVGKLMIAALLIHHPEIKFGLVGCMYQFLWY